MIDSLSPTQRPLDQQGLLPEVVGIFSGDMVLRHALLIGFQDLRQNPWQLDLVFASFLNDPYTINQYGQKLVDQAKQWFLKTEIPVILDVTLQNSPSMPCVIIGIQESVEAEATLGDIHYVNSQSTPAEWEPTTQKFSAQYNPDTGLIIPIIPVIVNDQMMIADSFGVKYPVLSVQVDANGNDNFFIQTGLNTDFSKSILYWSTSKLKVNIESLWSKETYNIVCNTKGEPYLVLYLYQIVKYCLLRYKKTLLEGRGFERTTISCSKVMPNNSIAPTGSENIWCRVITIVGYVKESWATTVSEKIIKAGYGPAGPDGLLVSQVGFLPNTFESDPSQEDPEYLTGDGIGVPL